VTQSNRLIEAAHTLTLNEKRLVLLAASMLDPRKPLPKDGFLIIRADMFAEVFQMEPRHAYQAVEEAAKRLLRRMMTRYKNGKVVEELRWVYHAKYKPGEGCVELGFSPTVVPHLTLLNKEFTSYQLRQIGHLSSFYAIRLYELMAQFLKLQERECTLEQLRTMLDLGDKYTNVKDLRKRVLDPAIKEVNLHTDITVEATPRRKGRMILGFTFVIKVKPPGEQQLELKV
jgi:plasmid replication initiation protein